MGLAPTQMTARFLSAARLLLLAPGLLVAEVAAQPVPFHSPQPETVLTSALPWRVEPAESGASPWVVVPADQPVRSGFSDVVPTSEPLATPTTLPATRVRGLSRGITVNDNLYTDTALQVPNGFAMDKRFTVSTSFKGVNRTRTCESFSGDSSTKCADGELNVEITPIKGEDASLGFSWNIQSLSSRSEGTDSFSGQSLGFRAAWNLSPTLGVSFGGEQIIQFDDTIDLGRNFYLVVSKAIPFSSGSEPVVAVATVGIGSDLFGYGGNGILGSTDCLSGRNISSNNFPSGTDCFWGPIGSLSLHLGSRVSLGAEWFGYGIGAGISARPFDEIPFTVSIYATDFLGNTPSYIEGLCTTNPCGARYYGRMTLSF